MVEEVHKKIGQGRCVGLVTDGWKDTSSKHVNGVVITTGDRSFSIDAEICGSDNDGVAVAREIEGLFDKHVGPPFDIPRFKYYCSDDAGQQGRGRRILALRHPDIIFLRCYAHQVNLMINALLKLPLFAAWAKKAAAAAKAIAASSSKWLPKLRDTVERYYGKKVSSHIFTVGETRWSSMQMCFASMLRCKHACKMFVMDHEDYNIPDTLKVWTDETFWMRLGEMELLIRPLCDASFLMQREGNTMAHVMLMFFNIYGHLAEFGPDDDVRGFKDEMEARWAREECHLFFLAFAMHPAFRDTAVGILNESVEHGNWTDDKNPLTRSRLKDAAVFYYRKFDLFSAEGMSDREKDKETRRLKQRLEVWLKGGMLTSVDEPLEGMESVVDGVEFWLQYKDEHPGFVNLAIFLLCAPIQSASCERLFKDFALYHTKHRNRMNPPTYLKQTQIKHDMVQMYGPADAQRETGVRKSSNRIVPAKEYCRIRDEETTDGMEVDQLGGDPDTVLDEIEEYSSDDSSEDEEDLVDDTEEEGAEQVDEIADFMKALELVIGDDDDELFYDPPPPRDPDNEIDDEDSISIAVEDPPENPPETRPETLEPLPLTPDKKYPQEDAHYFKKISNVRTDKFSLGTMLDGSKVKIPTLLSVFSRRGKDGNTGSAYIE
jgi:hypothetical protein